MLLVDVFCAYYDARRHKRNTLNQLAFEMDLEHHLVELARDIRERTYKVSPGVGFIVTNPVRREVFAADFRDRVVHHLLFNDINGIAERTLITDCYSCRKGYGTSYGVERLKHHIRSCTGNYTRRAHVLKMDIRGYFMSIDRELLYRKTVAMLHKYAQRKNEKGVKWKDTLDMDQTLFLLQQVIFDDPTANCHLRGRREEWDLLPPSKSLFHSRPGCGLPIGNLTSQLFSNIYLSDFDHYVKQVLGMRHYGRYVDDFYIIHENRQLLKRLPALIGRYLKDELGLTLHPDKTVIREVEQGIDFVGAHVKPYREYVVTRTRKSINHAIHGLEYKTGKKGEADKSEVELLRASMNSYMGYLRQFESYKIRKQLVDACENIRRYLVFDETFSASPAMLNE